MSAAITPISTAGRMGVCVSGFTSASFSANGSALSRAMAKLRRMAAVWTASAHTVTATTMQTRKILPRGPHMTCSTMYCRPPLLLPICGSARLGTAITANTRIAPPMTKDARIARRIARGAVRLGSSVSSPSELAVSKPYMTYPDASEATRNALR